MTKVAIITVNYNGKKDTLEFLQSLKNLKLLNHELKTILVDNGSSDGSVSSIHTQYPQVDIIQTGSNLGYGGGYNKGLEYAQIWGADYFLLINNDCLIKDQNLLDELIKTLKSETSIGFVSPKIYFAKGFEFHKDRYKEEDLGKVIWFAGGSFDWENIGSIHKGIDEVDKGQHDLVEESEIFSGAAVLIKKEVFERLSFFDEKYFLYFEDSDLSVRAQKVGLKKFYNGKTSIYHKVSQSTGIGSSITDYYHTRNRLMFGMKYANSKTKFALIREALWLLLFGRKSQRRGVLDFYLGERGGVNLRHLEGDLDSHPQVEYPLKFSIGIVNYNTPLLTRKLLDSIFDIDSGFRPSDMEVIVLDNGSSDSSVREIRAFREKYPSIKFLENKENEGFSKGYNKTIKFSLGEYYLMLNSDVEVLQNSLSELIKWAKQFEGKAVLGGKLVFPDGSDQDSVFHLPTIWGAFKEYFLSQKGSYFMYEPKVSEPVRVEGFVMACFMIPRKILDGVGLLDEGTFIFFEDIEYSRRLKKNGVSLYFVPSAKFIHHHGASTKKIGQEKAYELLQKSAKYYHGKFYYKMLSFILWLGQKLGQVETPKSRWTKGAD